MDRILKFSEKVNLSYRIHLVEIDTNPDQDLLRIRIGRPWMPIRFWIRQDADPTGSTTQIFLLFSRQEPDSIAGF
jgi:hypothetical protein